MYIVSYVKLFMHFRLIPKLFKLNCFMTDRIKKELVFHFPPSAVTEVQMCVHDYDYFNMSILIGSDPELLRWFAQAELMHSRWAMLAVAGILIPECLERLELIENFSWYNAGAQTYFADPVTLFVVQMILMGWVEGRRWADYVKPGCVDIELEYPNVKKPKPDVGYPGGLWFDPFMWGRGSPEPVMQMRTKEIKNGRLAMLAFVGFCFQAVYTGEGPLENLSAHLADPGHSNIFQV